MSRFCFLLLGLGHCAALVLPSSARVGSPQRATVARMQFGNPFEALKQQFAAATAGAAPPPTNTPAAAAEAVDFLTQAAETKAEDSQAVIDALVGLEKTMRAETKRDPRLSEATLAALDGAWRLVFTTGTVDTQKKVRHVGRPGVARGVGRLRLGVGGSCLATGMVPLLRVGSAGRRMHRHVCSRE